MHLVRTRRTQLTSASLSRSASSPCLLFLVLFLVSLVPAFVNLNENTLKLPFLVTSTSLPNWEDEGINSPTVPFTSCFLSAAVYRVVNIYMLSSNHKQICSGRSPEFKVERLCLCVIQIVLSKG